MLLIDGDQFLFKACAATEQEVKWDEQNHVLYSNEEQAWGTLVGMVERILERFPNDAMSLCFTSSGNFRKEVDPTYKANRQNSRRPMCYQALRERCEETWVCRAFPGLEADDVMGIYATRPGTKNIVVSQDKDMKTIPTTVWDGMDLMVYDEFVADYWHLYQTLVGDTSDGYKGCPGIGAVKASKLLEGKGVDAMWRAVVEAYNKAGLDEEAALVQARLARILRYSDWDAKKKQPILWTPPNASN